MFKEGYSAAKEWLARHPRRFVVYVLGGIFGITLLVQLFYPGSSLVPFSNVEGVALGAVSKEEAVKILDEHFKASKVAVYFEDDSESSFLKVTPGELGIETSNEARVDAMDYPWYLRLVPSSLFWAHIFSDDVAPLQYERNQTTLNTYIATKFGDTCYLDPENAIVEVRNKQFEVIEAHAGGDCDFDELTGDLSEVEPTVQGAQVVIIGEVIKPEVTTKQAQELADHVHEITEDGVAVNDGKNVQAIRREILVPWIDFAVVDGKLDYSFNMERSASYLGERVASLVEKPTGTTTVTLENFAEKSRDNGQSGVVFNQQAMLNSIKKSLEKGEKEVAVEVDIITPIVKYESTYSAPDAALSAVLKKYADTHPGTYGVSLRELSGQRRNASYRADVQYNTASTYKMFVAYSTLLRVESGAFKWTDSINSSRNLKECFADMIELSDNECAVTLLFKIGKKALTDEANAIGAVNTTFMKTDNIRSTAEDESLLLGLLESGQILTQQSSRDIWVNAMKENVYRRGIPAGIPSAEVANKVGFLDGWLHDASIVYSPKGKYVLVVLTENASWANIAELAGQIETLRTK